MSVTKIVTTGELKMITGVVEDGQKDVPEAMRKVKKGLYNLSYVY